MNLFDLAAKITLDSSAYESGIKEAESTGKGFSEKLKSGLGTAAKIGGASVVALGTTAVAVGKKLYDEAADVASYGDQIDKMSQKLGLSTDAYQEWDYVLGQAGVEITSMSVGLKTLTNKIDDAKNGSADAQAMFANLGISLEDLNSMSREDIFAATITGFQRMADSTERAALANDLFGRSGQELTPLFNSSIEDTNKLREAAHELGFVMSSEEVKASAAFNDALDTMKRTMDGVKRKLTVQFLPAFTKSFNAIAGLLSKNGKDVSKYKKELESGISEIVKGISDVIPEAVEIATTGAAAVVEAVAKQLPKELPNILNSAIKAAGSLAKSLVNAIPDIFGGIGAALGAVITNIPNIIELAVNLVKNLGKGILEGISQIAEGIGNGIKGLFSGPVSDDVAIAMEKIDEINDKMQEWREEQAAINDEMTDVDSQYGVYEYWLGIYDDLKDKTSLTKEEQALLNKAVEELNSILPETDKIVQNETGGWEGNTQAIYNNIEAMKTRAKSEIYFEKMNGTLEEMVQLEIDITEAENELTKRQNDLNKAVEDLDYANISNLSHEADLLFNALSRGQKPTKEASDELKAYAKDLGYSIDSVEGLSAVVTYLQNDLADVNAQLKPLQDSFDAQKNVVYDLTQSWTEMNDAVNSYATKGAELEAAAAQFEAAGEQTISGYISGMMRKKAEAQAAARGIASATLVAMKRGLEIASPSKKMRREVGQMAGKGLELGLLDAVPNVERASTRLSDAAMIDAISPEYNRSKVGFEQIQKSTRPIYLVLDSGEFVGATTKKYDEALGVENSLKLRWGGATA